MASSPDDEPELELAPLQLRYIVALFGLGLLAVALSIVLRPPRWLLDDAVSDSYTNGDGHGAEFDPETLIGAKR